MAQQSKDGKATDTSDRRRRFGVTFETVRNKTRVKEKMIHIQNGTVLIFVKCVVEGEQLRIKPTKKFKGMYDTYIIDLYSYHRYTNATIVIRDEKKNQMYKKTFVLDELLQSERNGSTLQPNTQWEKDIVHDLEYYGQGLKPKTIVETIKWFSEAIKKK
jgi:hypothetical protein